MTPTDLPDDLLAPEAVADPAAVAAVLREHDPVHWSPTHRSWLLTRYDDIVAAFRNPALSSDRVRPVLARREGRGPSAEHRVLSLISDWMVVSDPPAHTRLRRLAGGAFKQQQIAAMGERIQALVDELVDAFLTTGPGDLVAGVAYPLPATVIAEMLGAPRADRDRFREWSDELALVAFGTGGEARADRHARALRGLEEMAAYFRDLVADRRRDPAGDMLSAMIAGESTGPGDEEGLTDDELVGMCALLLFAGHETTTNAIANAVRLLTADPALRDRVAADPDLVAPAVEEALRLQGPIKVLVRWVVADHDLRGRTIRAGERVQLVLPGANRDPERFRDPDVLDLHRERNQHLAFGRGIHACIGAQLARLETRHAVGTVLRRLPGLRVTAEPDWIPTLASRAAGSLPVTFDAAPVGGRR
ncbi:cytochrome P450 [Actinomycetospora termitidis]|uniref:Cytochrome P450 n=1 Tax=Actinomycetospora termitidis TaxID=3053470 RepID=A0ABT7M9V0_9PSEU|nr:cytochrome P450 [Actinomycetospora sp. Odt1-22]MDL5157398.1 cytochrome P450 [Actinomycetospora sp. Odt1-22]